jgi:DNA mismatch repair protein MutS
MAMLKEYFSIQDKYIKEYGEKTILLYQCGAFFEVYTKVDSETRTITDQRVIDFQSYTELSDAYKNDTTSMLGFRDYSLDKYIKKIQNNGYTAVVYAQDAPTKNTTRSLFGVFSPGTFFSVDSNDITNNCTCIWIHENSKSLLFKEGNIIIGMSTVDIYTGKTNIYEVIAEKKHNPTTYDELERYLSIYNPSEIILISNMSDKKIKDIINFTNCSPKKLHVLDYDNNKVKNSEKQTYQRELLNKFYDNNISETIYLNTQHYTYGTQAFVYLLNFLFEHNPSLISKIKEPTFENTGNHMILANHSLKQLNMIDDHNYSGKYSSVTKFLNNCITPMGIRKFSYNLLNPIVDEETLNIEYDITEYLLNQENLWNSWRNNLKNMKDIEKFNRQIFIKKITPVNLFNFYNNLSTIKQIYSSINDTQVYSYLKKYINLSIVDECQTFMNLLTDTFILDICKSINTMDFDSNFIKPGVSEELDSITEKFQINESKLHSIKQYLHYVISEGDKKGKSMEFVKIHETEKSGISLICTKRRGTFLKNYISKTTESTVPLRYNYKDGTPEFTFSLDIEFVSSGASNVAIINDEIQKLCVNHTKYLNKIKDLVKIVYNDFLIKLEKYQAEISNIIDFVGLIDVLQNKCYIAEKNCYCKPEIITNDNNQSCVRAVDIRHALIEHLNKDELYVTNTFELGFNKNGMLLYGTNAVGKTSLIRALGVSIIMAQAGLFVPCSEFQYYPYKTLFTRILGNDNLFKGLSTFAVEMSELRVILRDSDKNSLILGDELCSGTEHESAISIFVAGLEDLHEKNCNFIFATHLHEIVYFEEIERMNKLDIKHMTVTYNKELDALEYDRKIKDGPGNSMYGLEVCKSLHLPDEFLENAYKIRKKYNNGNTDVLTLKTSHFNSNKIVDMCEMCEKKVGSEVHHLIHQQNADNKNHIKHFHKNHSGNLMTLCEECHDKIHKTGKQHKKVKTSKKNYILKVIE